MIPREKALEWAEDAGLPSLTDYGIECLIRLINHSNDEGQKAMRERAVEAAWEYYKEGPEGVDHAIRNLEIE